jgi:F0F1-type ATP synthase beta subunit
LDGGWRRRVPAPRPDASTDGFSMPPRVRRLLMGWANNEEKIVIDDHRQTWQDLRQIALSRSYEVRDWCRIFGCTKEELHDAVKAVGTSAQKVREYLKK